MFLSATFIRIDTVSVTKIDAEVEPTLSIASFTKIDTASVTRLDANIESIFYVILDDKINVKVIYI